jgi:hypothetical protein
MPTALQPKEIQNLKSDHFYYMLVLTYLVLPPVRLKQYQVLNCNRIPGRSFLCIDTGISCKAPMYKLFRLADIAFIFAYMSIPPIWFYLLYRVRNRLNPPTADVRLAVFLRGNDPKLSSLRFLFDAYLPKYFYFETVEMYRRILFVGILPLLSTKSRRKAAIGFAFGICSALLYREIEPFTKQGTNILAYGKCHLSICLCIFICLDDLTLYNHVAVAQYTVILTFGSALAIETNLSQGLNPLLFGVVLFSINLSVIILALAMAFRRFKIGQLEIEKQKSKQAGKLEFGANFSAQKFRTTFDAISRNYLPPSSCLVYWYCTVAEASKALESGIPALNACLLHSEPGIVFTMDQPHDMDPAESSVFPSEEREAVLACSLPRHLLQRLPGFPSTSSFRFFPGKVLCALRGSYFEDIQNPGPWYERKVMLPPQRIVRAYQLLEDFSCVGNKVSSPFSRPCDHHIDEELYSSQEREGSVQRPKSGAELAEAMTAIRAQCAEHGWAPLYHFTAPCCASLILSRGLRMSTLGQVHFESDLCFV